MAELDVSIYQGTGDAKKYQSFADAMPFYGISINATISMAKQYCNDKSIVADFCCGNGGVLKRLTHEIGGIEKAILVDNKPDFLKAAKSSGIKAKKNPYHSFGHCYN